FIDLINRLGFDTVDPQDLGSTSRGDNLKPLLNKIGRNLGDNVLVMLVDADEGHSGLRQNRTGANLRLYVSLTKTVIDTHHFARRLHLGSKNRVDAVKLDEWEYRGLHVVLIDFQFRRKPEIAKLFPDH